jgi:hypothetical protein
MNFRDEIIRGMVRQELSKLNEDVDLSQFPNPGKYDKSWLSKGQRDGSDGDDVVKTKKATIPASKLKPSQSEIFLAKSVGMAIGNMVGGDIGAVISKDNHILDGHHRWAATTLNDPKAKIGGIQAELPIKQLIPILRAAGDALGNARRGMPKGGDVNIFKATVDDIRAACYDGKNMDMQYYNKEKSIAWFEKLGEAELKKRLKAIQSKEPKNAPNRPNMPVIDAEKGEDSLVKKLFNQGDIDVKKPYAKESYNMEYKMKFKNEVIRAMVREELANDKHPLKENYERLFERKDKRLIKERNDIEIGKMVTVKKYNKKTNRKDSVKVKITDYIKKPGSKDFVEYEYDGKRRKVVVGVFKRMMESSNFQHKDKRLIKESFSGDLVLRQLGGNKFIAMTGAKNFVQSKADGYLAFKLPSNFAYEGINYVKVQLNSLDLYDVTFSKIRGGNVKEISRADGIYGDMLAQIFRKHTKLNTRL